MELVLERRVLVVTRYTAVSTISKKHFYP